MSLSGWKQELKVGFKRFLRRRSKREILIAGALSVLGISLLDYATGPELSLTIFYLFPIFFVEWLVGDFWGPFFSVVSGLAWFLADLLWRETLPHPLIIHWNFLVITGTFLLFDFVISSLQNALKRERTLARVDPLTGVFNRRAFLEMVRAELLRAQRTAQPLTIAYLDIDDFKQINDRYGHFKGDRVLAAVSRTIVSHVRATDIVARLGGDEFAVLLPQLEPRDARLVLKKLQASLTGWEMFHDEPISVSMGALTFLETPTSVDEMIIKADGLMYEVKLNGKGELRFQVDPGASFISKELSTI